jgi:hypothetical protein
MLNSDKQRNLEAEVIKNALKSLLHISSISRREKRALAEKLDRSQDLDKSFLR